MELKVGKLQVVVRWATLPLKAWEKELTWLKETERAWRTERGHPAHGQGLLVKGNKGHRFGDREIRTALGGSWLKVGWMNSRHQIEKENRFC